MESLQTLESLTPIIVLAALWTVPWKGWALWRAARRGEKGWFIALLLINTMAILDIIYLFVITKGEDTKPTDKNPL